MPIVPFPLGLSGTAKLPRTKKTLQNVVNIGNGRLMAPPGITLLTTTGNTARGSFSWNGSLYQVVSSDLIKITNVETGTNSVIGTIAGSANIRVAVGNVHAVIVVKGGNIYTLSKSDVLTDISGNSNFVPCVDVAHINSRFVYVPASGDPAFFSDVGAAGTVNVLSFFDAESLPDLNNGVINFRNTLFIFGEDSIEPFRDQGTSPVPFLRLSGQRIDNGYIGGLIEYSGSFVFLGREKGQDYGIYAFANGVAEKISNEAVDVILSEHTSGQREAVISNRFKWRGYDIVTFTLANATIGYYGGNWFRMRSNVGDDDSVWGGGFITQLDGKYYTAFRGNIGVLDDVPTDYGERRKFMIEMGIQKDDGKQFSCQSIELPISQGYNTSDSSVAIQMTRDGVDYADPYFMNLGDIGKYHDILKWNFPGGLGRYRGFMGFRFYSAEPLFFTSESPIVNLR